MKSEQVKPWVIDDGMIDVSDQAQMLIDNIGTDRAWIAVGINDEEGFAEVVALTHPLNAPLVAAAPELLSACVALMAELQSRFDYVEPTPEESAALCKMEAAIARAFPKAPRL